MEQYLRLHASPRRKQLLFNECWCQYWRICTPANSWTICWCTSKLQWRKKPYSTHTWIATQTTWWGTVKYRRLVSITWGLMKVVMKLTFPKIVIFFSVALKSKLSVYLVDSKMPWFPILYLVWKKMVISSRI